MDLFVVLFFLLTPALSTKDPNAKKIRHAIPKKILKVIEQILYILVIDIICISQIITVN